MTPPEDNGNEEENFDFDNPPPGYSIMSISADEIDYLKSYWELRDTGQMFGWALRLLYDMSKLDEKGWLICLQKGSYDEETGEITSDPRFKTAAFRLKQMMPKGSKEFVRLPVDAIEEAMKKPDGSVGGIKGRTKRNKSAKPFVDPEERAEGQD